MSQESIQEEITKESITKDKSDFKKQRFFLISYGSLIVIIFILGIIAIIISGACKIILKINIIF